MKNVCIVQDELLPGGKTKVIFKVVEILNKHNIIPDFYCYDNISQKEIFNIAGKNIKFNLKKILDFGIKRFTLYKSCLLLPLVKNKIRKYDIIFNSTHWLNKDFCQYNLINYIYYLYPLEYTEQDSCKIPFHRKLYLQPLRWINKDTSTENNSTYGMTIAISQFTKKKIEELFYPLKNKVKVIYPPVDIKSFLNRGNNRLKQVVSIGNFEPQKDQLSQIEIASAFSDLKFIITGFVSTKIRSDYYKKCDEYINNHKIKNVELRANLSAQDIKALLQQSEYFIHTRENEHFGISTVEAIASGCIPLVHNSGGQVEIVPYDDLRFNSTEEAINKLENIVNTNTNSRRKELQNYIQNFSEERFEEQLNELIGLF